MPNNQTRLSDTSDSEEGDILFWQPVVLFLMKKTKKRKREKKWEQELFRKGEKNGGFNNLIQEMKLAGTESFLSKI